MPSVVRILSRELSRPQEQTGRLVELFDDGCEVAFIARYRRQAVGEMNCDELRDAFNAYRRVSQFVEKAEKAVDKLTKMVTDENERKDAIRRVEEATDEGQLAEVMDRYKQAKKRTKLAEATAKGLPDVADRLLASGGTVPKLSAEEHELLVVALADRLCKTETIESMVLEFSAIDQAMRKHREFLFVEATVKKARDGEFPPEIVTRFSTYDNFSRSVARVEEFQILALDRAEDAGYLKWRTKLGDKTTESLRHTLLRESRRLPLELKDLVVARSLTKQLVPKIERAARQWLLRWAETGALRCFAANLRQLLSVRPLKDCGEPDTTAVLALDPGFAHGCKVALLSARGEVLATEKVFLEKGSSIFAKDGEKRVAGMVQQHLAKDTPLVVAVGNGTATKETQNAVAQLLQKGAFGKGRSVKYCVVPETGASKYSVTALAEKELPNLDVNLRSAVSIGRRLIDPLAEYVKIEPRHLGVGMYQHSVTEKKLDEWLRAGVREIVSLAGVDVNRASAQLLENVAGLNTRLAEAIVQMRESLPNKTFQARSQIQSVKGIGQKIFDQCAGFLLVHRSEEGTSKVVENSKKRRLNTDEDDGEPKRKKKKVGKIENWSPLDATPVRPCDYGAAEILLETLGHTPQSFHRLRKSQNSSDFKQLLARLEGVQNDENKSPDERLIAELLILAVCEETRRKSGPAPMFLTDRKRLQDLKIDEMLTGRVESCVPFGAFIDVGCGKSVLAHRTKIPAHVQLVVGDVVEVCVKSIDTQSGNCGVAVIGKRGY